MDPQTLHPPLAPLIRRSLETAAARRARLQSTALRLTLVAVVAAALATFFAGLSSLTDDPVVADDWRVTCAIASLCTLVATLSGGLQPVLVRPDRLTRASECVGKLRTLLFEAETPDHDQPALRRKFQQVIVDHDDLEL
jgi:hypothetical protein